MVSVLVESLIARRPSAASLGGLLAYVAFNGYQTSTMNFQTFSQVAFAFAVTPLLLVQGLAYALAMGLSAACCPASGRAPADRRGAARAVIGHDLVATAVAAVAGRVVGR